MMFTPVQLIILTIITEFFIYLILLNITHTIRHCATAKYLEKSMKKHDYSYTETTEGIEDEK